MAEPTERIAILLELQKQEFEKRAKSAGAAIDRLERKFSPLAAAEAKLEKQQLRFNAALEAGTIDAAQHAKGMDLVQREYEQTIARSKSLTNNVVAMNGAVSAQTGFMTRNRAVFQQAGYQVGDFAVQVQGGQSALVAFSQQGSQLLGVLGPWGAVMGAVLAVGSSLAGVLFRMGDATEETKEKAKTFTDRLIEANTALADMSSTAGDLKDLEALRAKYGELTQEVKDMALALFEIDQREALAQVGGIISEITDQIAAASAASSGVVSAALASAGTEVARVEADAYRKEIEAIQADIEQRQGAGFFVDQSELNILAEMREELAVMQGDFANIGSLVDEIRIDPQLLSDISTAQENLEAARESGDFTAMADHLGTIRDLLNEAGDTVNQDVVDGVTNAEALSRDMAARLEEGKDAAEGIAHADIASGISAGVDEAAKLAKNLGISLATAQRIAALGPQGVVDPSAEVGRSGAVDPRTVGGSSNDRLYAEADAFLANYNPKTASGGGSSGGGSRGRRGSNRDQEPLFSIAESELAKLELQISLLGKSKSEIAELTTKQKLLDEAKKRGLTVTEELAKQINAEAAEVGALADQYESARDKIAAIESIQGQFKDSVIDAAAGGADAFDSFKEAIKRAAIEYALFGTGTFANLGGGSSGGGLLGGLFGGVGLAGLIPGFANGTNNAPGGLATINERGGELVNLPNGSQVIPHDLSKRMIDARSGGGGVVRHEIRIVADSLTLSDDGVMQTQVRAEMGNMISSYDSTSTLRTQHDAQKPRRRR